MITIPCFWSSNSILTSESFRIAANFVLASCRHLKTSLVQHMTTQKINEGEIRRKKIHSHQAFPKESLIYILALTTFAWFDIQGKVHSSTYVIFAFTNGRCEWILRVIVL